MSNTLSELSYDVFDPGGRAGRVETVEMSGAQVGQALFGQDGPSFKDLLAAVNPLQHIPVIGTIYRYLTGDTISPGARLAGGALYGGPIGLLGAAVNAAIEGGTGKDIGDHVLALVVDPKSAAPDAPPTMLAEAAPAPAPPTPAAPPPAATETGPAVTANPVAPVVRAAAAPVDEKAPLTPEAYARAMARANGRAVPPLPTRGADASAPAELSNEDFVRLLAAFGQGNAASPAPPQPPAQPMPVMVPVAGAEYRSPRAPAIVRAPGRFTPIVTR